MIKLLFDYDSILMHNKVFPVHGMKVYWGSRSRAPSIPSALNGGERLTESPGRFTSVKDTQNTLYRSLGGFNKIFLR